MSFSLSIQSHIFQFQAFKVIFFNFRRSEPFISILGFRAISSSLSVQSHHFQFQAFRSIYSSLGIQYHHFPLYAFKTTGVQSHCLKQAFKTIGLQSHSSNKHSKPSFSWVFIVIFLVGVQSHLPQLGIQSYLYSFRHLKPPFSQAFRVIPLIGVQSHHFLALAFRVTIFIGVQSHHFSSQVFRATTTLTLAFKATRLQSHSPHRHSKP